MPGLELIKCYVKQKCYLYTNLCVYTYADTEGICSGWAGVQVPLAGAVSAHVTKHA